MVGTVVTRELTRSRQGKYALASQHSTKTLNSCRVSHVHTLVALCSYTSILSLTIMKVINVSVKSREYAKCCKTRDSACSDNGNDDDGNTASVKVQGTLSSIISSRSQPDMVVWVSPTLPNQPTNSSITLSG